jgi:hypothetical protein
MVSVTGVMLAASGVLTGSPADPLREASPQDGVPLTEDEYAQSRSGRTVPPR